MIFRRTALAGAWIVEPEKIEDFRGFFSRAWCRREFEAYGLNPCLAQVNMAFSRRAGTLRGMHYQLPPFAEAKSVRCVRGAVYDVAIDLRPESPTYRQWTGVELTAENRRMFFIPEGFAHGYQTLADDSEVLYQVSQFYAREYERGIRWNDPAFAVEWPQAQQAIVSQKDAAWPLFAG